MQIDRRLLQTNQALGLMEGLFEDVDVFENVSDFTEFLDRLLNLGHIVADSPEFAVGSLRVLELVALLPNVEDLEDFLGERSVGEFLEENLDSQNEDHVEVSHGAEEEIKDLPIELLKLFRELLTRASVLESNQSLETQQIDVNVGEVEDFLQVDSTKRLLGFQRLAMDELVLEKERVIEDEVVFQVLEGVYFEVVILHYFIEQLLQLHYRL